MKNKQLHIRLSAELRRKLKIEAAKRGVTISDVIEAALKLL